MFYVSEIKKLYEAVKSDNSIEECDKQKIIELTNQLVCILAQY